MVPPTSGNRLTALALREAAIVAAICLIAALLFTWPLLPQLTREIPTGSRPETVALFGLFTAEWTAQVLDHGAPYWDAPFFHPHRGAFAWSEPQPFTSVAIWLVSKAVGGTAAYNLVLLVYLTLGGVAGYALARQLTADRFACLWAALWTTAGAYAISNLTILHLLAGAFPIGCLACLVALGRRPGLGLSLGAAAAYALTLTTCLQFGLLLTMLLPILVAILVVGRRWKLRSAAIAAGPLGASLLIALPLLLTQRSLIDRMGFERGLNQVQGAYGLGDLLLPARGHWLTSGPLTWSDAPGAYPSDLGVVALLCLTAAAAFGGLRKLRSLDPILLRQRAAVAAVTLTALVLGFGPRIGVSYTWLRAVVPGLDSVRTPARFGMFATAGTAALGAVALGYLRGRMRTRRMRHLLTAGAFVLLAAEMWAIPIGLVDPERGLADHQETLDRVREHAGGEPLLELPMADGDGEAALATEVRAMRRGLVHGSPVANGYSGYFPETYVQLRDAMRSDAAGRGLRYLRALGVRYVLLHEHDLAAAQREARLRALGGEVVFWNGEDTLIRLDEIGAVEPTHPTTRSRQFRAAPVEGTILGLPIPPARQARLVTPGAGQTLECSWQSATGVTERGTVRLRGAVLVDAGSPWVHAFVQKPPRGGRVGEAVLASAERRPGARR